MEEEFGPPVRKERRIVKGLWRIIAAMKA